MRVPANRAVPANPKRPEAADLQARSLRASGPQLALSARFGLSESVITFGSIVKCRRSGPVETDAEFLRFRSPLTDPAAARVTPASLHAVLAASSQRSSGQRRKGGTSFFRERFCSLWRPLQPRRRCADRERSGPP